MRAKVFLTKEQVVDYNVTVPNMAHEPISLVVYIYCLFT